MVLSKYGTVTDYALYSMGLRDSAELDKMIQQFAQNQSVDVPSDFRTYSYDELLGLKFKLVNSADTYVYDETYKRLEEQGRRQGVYAAAGGKRRGHHHRGHRPAGLHRLGLYAHLRHRLPCLPHREGHGGRRRQRHREAADGRPHHQRPHRRELRQGREHPQLRPRKPLLHRHQCTEGCVPVRRRCPRFRPERGFRPQQRQLRPEQPAGLLRLLPQHRRAARHRPQRSPCRA